MDGQRVQRAGKPAASRSSRPACTAACPLHRRRPRAAGRSGQGDFAAAFVLLPASSRFPPSSATSATIPAKRPAAARTRVAPIRIAALERACVERRLRHRLPAQSQPTASGSASPSSAPDSPGLTAAADLARQGARRSTVFEAGPALLDRLRALRRRASAAHRPSRPTSARLRAARRRDALGAPVDGRRRAGAARAASRSRTRSTSAPAPSRSPGADQLSGPEGRIASIPSPSPPATRRSSPAAPTRYAREPYSPIRSLCRRPLRGPAPSTACCRARRSPPARESAGRHRNPAPRAMPPRHPPRRRSCRPIRRTATPPTEGGAEAARCFPCHCLRMRQGLRLPGPLQSATRKRYVREIYNNDTIVMGAAQVEPHDRLAARSAACAPRSARRTWPWATSACRRARAWSRRARCRSRTTTSRCATWPSAAARPSRWPATSRASTASALLFFPGCQLAASSPDHVARIYAPPVRARGRAASASCSAAAARPRTGRGAGDLFDETRAEFRADGNGSGKPPSSPPVRAATACSASTRPRCRSSRCGRARAGRPPAGGPCQPRLAIHDPCTTRHDDRGPAAVRPLRRSAASTVEELDGAELTTCCGFGGLAQFANPRGRRQDRRPPHRRRTTPTTSPTAPCAETTSPGAASRPCTCSTCFILTATRPRAPIPASRTARKTADA